MLTTFHHITGLITIYGEWISLFIVQVSSALHTDLPAQMVRWKNTVSKSSKRCRRGRRNRRGSSSNCVVAVEVSSQIMYLYNFVLSKPSSFQTIYFPDCWRPFWKHHVWTTAGDKSKIFSSWTKLIEEVCCKGSWAWTCTTSMTAVKALSKGKLMLRFVMPCTAHLYVLLNMSEAEDRPCTVAVDIMKASSLAISYVPPTRNTRWWWDVPGCGSKRSPCFKISLLAPDIFGSWEYTRWAPNQYGTSLKLINWPLTATRETIWNQWISQVTTDSLLSQICSSCPHLALLDISFSRAVTDVGIEKVDYN